MINWMIDETWNKLGKRTCINVYEQMKFYEVASKNFVFSNQLNDITFSLWHKSQPRQDTIFNDDHNIWKSDMMELLWRRLLTDQHNLLTVVIWTSFRWWFWSYTPSNCALRPYPTLFVLLQTRWTWYRLPLHCHWKSGCGRSSWRGCEREPVFNIFEFQHGLETVHVVERNWRLLKFVVTKVLK